MLGWRREGWWWIGVMLELSLLLILIQGGTSGSTLGFEAEQKFLKTARFDFLNGG